VALVVAITTVLCATAPIHGGFGWAAALTVAASMAVLSAEIAQAYHQLRKDAWGFIDSNEHGCRFPIPGGFNQTYTIDLVEAMSDKLAPIVRASPALMNAGDKASANSSVQSYTTMGLAQSSARPNNTIILLMLILGGVYFIMEGDDE